jgi:hypothetical protein
MMELFPMGTQVAHIRTGAVASSTVATGAILAGLPHIVCVTHPSNESISYCGFTPSIGQTTLNLSTAGSPSHLSTSKVLAKMHAQMAAGRKQQATNRRDETHRKYRMEKLPMLHDLEACALILSASERLREIDQSQNGLIESHWGVPCGMARGLLAEAQLPKYDWSRNPMVLDDNKSIGAAFPSLHYDGRLHVPLYSDPKEDSVTSIHPTQHYYGWP